MLNILKLYWEYSILGGVGGINLRQRALTISFPTVSLKGSWSQLRYQPLGCAMLILLVLMWHSYRLWHAHAKRSLNWKAFERFLARWERCAEASEDVVGEE